MIHECVEILSCNPTAFTVLEKEPLIADISMYLEALQCEVAPRGMRLLFPKSASLSQGYFCSPCCHTEVQRDKSWGWGKGLRGCWDHRLEWERDVDRDWEILALQLFQLLKKIRILLAEEGRGDVQTGIIRAVPKNSRAVTSTTLLNEAFAEQDSKLNISLSCISLWQDKYTCEYLHEYLALHFSIDKI